MHEIAPRHPTAFGHLLQAVDFYVSPTREVAIVGPAGPLRDGLEDVVRSRPRPHLVLAGDRPIGEPATDDRRPGEPATGDPPTGDPTADGAVPLLAGRTAVDGQPAAYVCERFACRQPVTTPDELAALLGPA